MENQADNTTARLSNSAVGPIAGSMIVDGSETTSQDCTKSLIIDLNNFRNSDIAKVSSQDCIDMLIKLLQEGGLSKSG